MALIECPECGKEVSNSAKTCVHCGYKQEKYDKIGGWLILVIFGYIYSFISNIIVFFGDYNLYLDGTVDILNDPNNTYYNPKLYSAVNYETAMSLLISAFIIACIILMLKKKKIYPICAILLIISSHFLVVTQLLIYGDILEYSSSDISSIVGGIIGGIVWIIYFLKSKRVKQIFIK